MPWVLSFSSCLALLNVHLCLGDVSNARRPGTRDVEVLARLARPVRAGMKRQREIKDTIRYLPFGQINPTMGKKGKRGDKPAEKKAILKRIDALAKKLEEELKGADLFAPLPPMDDCPICLVRLPRMDNSKLYQGCCGKYICFACFKENYRVIDRS